MRFVDIILKNNLLYLRARSSELFITPEHVNSLQELEDTDKFSEYFQQKALVNRTARKLFHSWLRKDPTLWKRLYKVIRDSREDESSSEKDGLEKVDEEKKAPEEDVAAEKEPAAPKETDQ